MKRFNSFARIVVLFMVAPVVAQGVRYSNIVLTSGGFPNANVNVCTEPASGTPCTPQATVYSDPGLTMPITQPFQTDANGNFAFFATPGTGCPPSLEYHVQISGTGLTTYDIPYITIGGGCGSGTVTSITATSPIVVTPSPITGVGVISCPTCATGSSGVSGSGTTGYIPEWSGSTSLGNSNLFYSSTDFLLDETDQWEFGIVLPTTGGSVLTATNTIPSGNVASSSYNTMTMQSSMGGYGGTNSITNNTTLDVVENTARSASVLSEYGIEIENEASSLSTESGTTTTRAGLYILDLWGIGSSDSRTVTSDYGIDIAAPTISGGTVGTRYGVYIGDQSSVGSFGTNSNPYDIYAAGVHAPNAFQGHIDQVASGNWAGTCAMSTTTCTITLSAAYTSTPGCIATVQGTTPIAAACQVSGTTVTITAATSNTQTWAAMLFGNPN